MGNRLTPAGGSDSDYFRRQAYLQDSEALSEDLVRSIVGSGAFQDLRGLLGTTVEQALRRAVADALKDPEIQKAIREQVANTVIAGLKKEIQDRQTEILSNARKTLIPMWEDQTARAVVQDRMQDNQGSIIEDWEPSAEEYSERREDRPRRVQPRKPLPAWLKPAAIAAGIVLPLALVVGLLLGRNSSSRPEPRSETREPDTRVVEREERARETEETSQERLFVDRMRIPESGVENGSDLAAELQAHSYTDQYRCWFDEDARRSLEDLLDNPRLKRSNFEETLRGAFAPCVATDYPVGTSKLPVFAAQGLIKFLLEREQADGWDLCPNSRKPAGLPDLANFASDGKPGPTTFALLNGFLECIDRSAQLQIGPNSTSEEYLFTVYAALKELERR